TGHSHAHGRDVVTSFRRIVERLDVAGRARHLGVTRRVVRAVVRGRIGVVGVGCRVTVAIPVVPIWVIASVVAAGIRIAVTVARTVTVTTIPAAAVTTVPATIAAIPAATPFPAATSTATASLRLGR